MRLNLLPYTLTLCVALLGCFTTSSAFAEDPPAAPAPDTLDAPALDTLDVPTPDTLDVPTPDTLDAPAPDTLDASPIEPAAPPPDTLDASPIEPAATPQPADARFSCAYAASPRQESDLWAVYDFSFGGGGLDGQFQRVFDSIDFGFGFQMGLRIKRWAMLFEFNAFGLSSPVVTPLTALSVGFGGRYYLPWWTPREHDFEVWVSNGIGYTGLTTCDEDEGDCELEGDAVLGEYKGMYLSSGVGAAWVFYQDVQMQMYLTTELKRTWHRLENQTLDRHITGGYWAMTVGYGVAFAP